MGQMQAFRTYMMDNLQLIQVTQASILGRMRHMMASQNTMASNIQHTQISQIDMVEQAYQWKTFQKFMEHRHHEMLEHLRFSQAVEGHHNNQLDSLSAQLMLAVPDGLRTRA